MIQVEPLATVEITKSEQASLLSAITQMVADLLQTPGMEQQFTHLYGAQAKLARLFGYEPESVDVVLANTMTYREAFRNNPANAEHTRMRVSQPPDTPSSPLDLPSVGYVGQCDCGDVDCCDTEPEEDESDVFDARIGELERERTEVTKCLNRLENRIIDADLRSRAINGRTDIVMKEVQHWHQRITELHNQLCELQKSVKNLKEAMGIL